MCCYSGDVWHVTVEGLKDVATLCYGWRADADIGWQGGSRFHPGGLMTHRVGLESQVGNWAPHWYPAHCWEVSTAAWAIVVRHRLLFMGASNPVQAARREHARHGQRPCVDAQSKLCQTFILA